MSVQVIPAEKYVEQLLAGRDFISSEDIPLANDFDYVMSLMIAAEYDYQNSSYTLEFADGDCSKNGYTIPMMKIGKKV